jgi:DNA-binding transcriptional ArsR family regulator
MEIDRKTLKALAADTRINILKSLSNRRKTPSELSKELNLAASTVVEHLNRLEEADLVRREETGHKWIYYNLTEKGSNIIKPKFPNQFVLVLSLGLMFIFVGISRYFIYTLEVFVSQPLAAPVAGETSKAIPSIPTFDWSSVILLSIGIILVLISLIKLKKH